jgi:riboflavin synthase
VAVNGACLTVVPISPGLFKADVLEETLDRTCMRHFRPGDKVNIERAVRVGDLMGGHYVTGHVDGVGRIASIRTVGRDRALRIDCQAGLLADMVVKGSVAVNGVSLTLAAVNGSGFEVHLVPATVQGTTMGFVKPGEPVNIETDLIAKHVRRGQGTKSRALTENRLRDAGFA